jgi:trehalose 6-phosphate synthase
MSLCDVLLVNSLADGMNLVAKEGVLLNMHDGVLVLSRQAGAWEELEPGAIGIDPLDVEGTAAALYEALHLRPAQRRERAQRLRGIIRSNDLAAWFDRLLGDIETHAAVPG